MFFGLLITAGTCSSPPALSPHTLSVYTLSPRWTRRKTQHNKITVIKGQSNGNTASLTDKDMGENIEDGWEYAPVQNVQDSPMQSSLKYPWCMLRIYQNYLDLNWFWKASGTWDKGLQELCGSSQTCTT